MSGEQCSAITLFHSNLEQMIGGDHFGFFVDNTNTFGGGLLNFFTHEELLFILYRAFFVVLAYRYSSWKFATSAFYQLWGWRFAKITLVGMEASHGRYTI